MLAARRMMIDRARHAAGPVTFVGYTQGPTSSAFPTWSVSPPAVGDLILVHAVSRGSGVWTVPSGYTQVRQDITSDLYLTVFRKVATSTEVTGGPGTFTPAANTAYGVAVASVWHNANSSSPVLSSGSRGFIDQPQLVGIANGVYVASVAWGWNVLSSPGWNPPLNSQTTMGANTTSNGSWVMVGYEPLTTTRNPEPPGATDYSESLGTSATAGPINVGLVLQP